MRGDFSIWRNDTRSLSSKQRHVFLFSNVLLISKFRLSAPPTSSAGASSSNNLTAADSYHQSGDRTANALSLPIASALLQRAKLYSSTGSNGSLAGASSQSDSKPVYAIEHALPVSSMVGNIEFLFKQLSPIPNRILYIAA